MFNFGEKVEGYEVNVFNEREIRAGTGILFLIAMIGFFNIWFTGDYTITKWFVVLFLIDFIIRLFFNSRYSPILILAKILVQNQEPEYTGAPQKRFAWTLGFFLALIMFNTLIIFDIKGPLNMIICLMCLTFFFLEVAFGICVGCKMYNTFTKNKSMYCPGNVCSLKTKNRIDLKYYLILIAFIIISFVFINNFNINQNLIKKEKDCTVPQYAIAMGHEEMWKKHHNCE